MDEKQIDWQLVLRAQRGEKLAFDLLVAKYHRKIIRLASRFVHDPVEAEDVAQETFVRAYYALPQFHGQSAFYTWLYRIAVNTATNTIAKQNRRISTLNDFILEDDETFTKSSTLRDINTPEAVLMNKQMIDELDQAMADLTDELRIAIVLREIEGLSYEEIAEVMNCPVGTVRSRIFRAREAIVKRLQPLLSYSD